MSEALSRLSSWHRGGHGRVSVAVNLSVGMLRDDGLAGDHLGVALPQISSAGIAFAIWLQGFGVDEAIRAAVGGFELEMIRSTGADPGATGADFGRLVERGGLYGMANTLIVIISALATLPVPAKAAMADRPTTIRAKYSAE